MRLKKLYILAALEVERHHDLIKAGKTHGNVKDVLSAAITTELDIPGSTARHLDKPWKAALAHHLFLLAQRQQATGQWEAATRTCVRLKEFEDVFGNDEMARQTSALLCLSAIRCGRLSTSSKALCRLEAPGSPDRGKFEELAIAIFSKFAPVDPSIQLMSCPNCGAGVHDRCVCAFLREGKLRVWVNCFFTFNAIAQPLVLLVNSILLLVLLLGLPY